MLKRRSVLLIYPLVCAKNVPLSVLSYARRFTIPAIANHTIGMRVYWNDWQHIFILAPPSPCFSAHLCLEKGTIQSALNDAWPQQDKRRRLELGLSQVNRERNIFQQYSWNVCSAWENEAHTYTWQEAMRAMDTVERTENWLNRETLSYHRVFSESFISKADEIPNFKTKMKELFSDWAVVDIIMFWF